MFRRFGPWPVLVLLLSFAIPAAPVRAESRLVAAQGAEICERAIANGARRAGLPQEVLHAISLTETGRVQGGRLRPYPWAINREGKGFWFQSREEALAFARKSVAEGRHSFDVGCFQINYRWHGRNFASLEAMFDPDTGADYAARFLKGLHAERGTWSAAAGAYHSQTPARANVYRARFDRIVAGLNGKAPLAPGLSEPGSVTMLAEAEAAPAPAAPVRSRTRLKGPKIITIPPEMATGTPRVEAKAVTAQVAQMAWAGQ